MYFFYVVSMMFVGTAAARKYTHAFLFVATIASGIFDLIQHVVLEPLHGLVMENLLQRFVPAVADGMLDLGMAARIGFTGRKCVDMYPRIYAECFAVCQQESFTLSEFYRSHQIGAVIVIGWHTILSMREMWIPSVDSGADRTVDRIS